MEQFSIQPAPLVALSGAYARLSVLLDMTLSVIVQC